MERINARRAARGREQLVNLNNSYQENDEQAIQRKPALSSERSSALDQYKGQKSLRERMAERGSIKDEAKARSEEFAKRFKPKGSMGIGKSVESEAAKLKKKPVMGIGTPSLQGSFNRFTA
jgi:hypothetical protein